MMEKTENKLKEISERKEKLLNYHKELLNQIKEVEKGLISLDGAEGILIQLINEYKQDAKQGDDIVNEND